MRSDFHMHTNFSTDSDSTPEQMIEGAIQKSKMWLVPADAKKPEDPRREKKNAARD